MNMLLPDKFARITGAKVKVSVYDIRPLGEDFAVAPILLSVLRDLAQDSEIVIDFDDDVLNEVTLSEKRIDDALKKTDADVLVFGSYVATRANVQPMIHIVCTYGRPMDQTSSLPEGMDLNQAILDGDAILQIPRHVLLREVLPVSSVESLTFQNALAEEIFSLAEFIQALKMYKAEKFEETVQLVNGILTRSDTQDQWPSYWAPYSYLHMLGGLAYLRMGNPQAAMYTLSNALTRTTPARMRIQQTAEQILAMLIAAQESASEAEKAPEDAEAPAAEVEAGDTEKESPASEKDAPDSEKTGQDVVTQPATD